MKKALWKGTFCILVALLFILPANAVWIEKMEGVKENNELSRMNSPIPQEKRWERKFGRLLFCEEGYSVQQTNDGGYILVATAYYETGGIWLIKVNANGIKEWDKKFGGWGISGKCVQQTNDGGYIIAGEGRGDIWLLKTDSNGNEEWSRTFGGSGDEWMWGDRLVQQTNDGGYIITAATQSYGSGKNDVWLLKTNANGNEEWNRTFGEEEHEWGGSVQQTNDGGYIITGATCSYGHGTPWFWDVWLIKTDESGIEEWNKTFGGEHNDRGFSVQQTNDEGYIIGGYTYDANWIIKTDFDGNEEWNSSFADETVYSIQQTNDGGYITTGRTFSNNLSLIKLDSNGNLEWKRIFGKPRHYYEKGNCVRQTNDGGYIIVGTKQLFPIYATINAPLFLDVWLIKTDKMGKAMDLRSNNGYGIAE